MAVPSTSSLRGPSGSRCRSRTARDSTRAIRGSPLTRATSGSRLVDAAHARVEVAGRRQHDAGLAERRQHLLDVAQEERVGPDQQHAAAGQAVAVGVEEVRRPVQRHGGLAGAGTALDDQRTRQVAADHPVLLGLDGRDDVAHPPGAVGADGGHQGALAGQGRPGRRRPWRPGRAPRPRGRPRCGRASRGAGDVRRPAGRPPSPGRRSARPVPASRRGAGSAPRRRARGGRCSGGPRPAGRAARRPAGPPPPPAGRAGPRAAGRTRRARSGSAACRWARPAGCRPAPGPCAARSRSSRA